MTFSDYPKILSNEQARGTSLYKFGERETLERVKKIIEEMGLFIDTKISEFPEPCFKYEEEIALLIEIREKLYEMLGLEK